jgi:formylglycine-generating enzyme required for sulfatase activity
MDPPELAIFEPPPLVAAWQPSAQPPPSSALTCPEGTKLVVGTHHEQVQRYCLLFERGQCWDYHPGVVAFEMRATPIATCMDEFEWPNNKGDEPAVMLRFGEAEELCRSAGKRLCTEFEWELACEGPASLPYPYGWRHERSACNNDKPYKPYDGKKLTSADKAVRDAEVRRLYQGEGSGSRPGCVSSFGVADLVGNVEEWVRTSRPEWAYPSSLKGGYWSKAWTGCRGTNDSHGPLFRFYEIGLRCCAEPSASPAPTST